jgi:hypothetical protein
MQRQSAAYQDAYFSTHPSSGAIPASTYPFSSSNTAYPTQSYSSEGSYVPPAYPYATPAPSTYDSIYSSQDQSGAARRPGLRRGDPYDGVFEPAYTSYSDSDPYAYTHDAPSDYTRQRRSSLSRSGSTYDNARQAFASTDVSPPGTQAYEVPGRPITRRSSDRWSTHGHSPQDQYAMPRPRPVRGDSGASWGGTRESALFVRPCNITHRNLLTHARPCSSASLMKMAATATALLPLILVGGPVRRGPRTRTSVCRARRRRSRD